MISGYVGVGFEVAGQYNQPLFPIGNEDPGAGLVGAVGILMALVERRRTGQGQYVESPQLNATLAHMAHVVRRPDGAAVGAERLDPLQLGVSALDRLYETADGWLCVVATGDEQTASLGRVIGVDLLGDERFATGAAREHHDYELSSLIGDALEQRKTSELLAELTAADVPSAAPVAYNNVTFMTTPENVRSGRVAVCADPTQARVRELGVLVRVSDAGVAPHRLAPSLGEHTDEILTWLGYDAGDIADLRARGQVT